MPRIPGAARGTPSVQKRPVPGRPSVAHRSRGPTVYQARRWPTDRPLGGPPLPGKPGSPEFIAAYNAAIAQKVELLLSLLNKFSNEQRIPAPNL
jgi:hypothetical protein